MQEENIELLLKELEQKKFDTKLLAYISLQFTAGLRISDLLKINHSNITPNLLIAIEQGKGSNVLNVQPVFYRDIWRAIRDNKLSPMSCYNRFWFYKLYKKLGIVVDNGTGRNNSVTHAPRKMLARELYANDNNLEVAKNALGHKDERSTLYYIDPNYRQKKLDSGLLRPSTASLDPIVLQKNGIIRITRMPIVRKK